MAVRDSFSRTTDAFLVRKAARAIDLAVTPAFVTGTIRDITAPVVKRLAHGLQ
jgi:hypothetical protein